MLCPLKGESHYARRGGAVARGRQRPVPAGRSPRSPSARGLYWACQVSEKTPRAENALQPGRRGWPGAVRGRGVLWENVRGRAGASPPPGTGHDAPELRSLDVTPLGTFRKGLRGRTGWSDVHFSAQVVGLVCQLPDERDHRGRNVSPGFWACPLPPSSVLRGNAN